MNKRIRALIKLLSSRKAGAFLATDDVNVSYLSGFSAREAWLLIIGSYGYFLTDSRYITEADHFFRDTGITVIESKGSITAALFVLLNRHKIKILGLDERYLSAAAYHLLREKKPGTLRLKSVDGVVDELRMQKDPSELLMIREAIRINLLAYRYLEPRIRPGRKEKDLLLDLEGFIRKKGVSFSFPPIIASGPNAAMPHARVSERQISTGEALLVDVGIEKSGYKSDLTRMFFLGKMTRHFKDIFCHVREAQSKAIAFIKPGVMAKDVDGVARNYLKKHGLDHYFGHSLGHGVGLEVHERPAISQKSEVLLAENMVFTIEPGVYFPDKFGIRLEEMVLVTQSGCEVLSVDYD